jgi:hypothetical protein
MPASAPTTRHESQLAPIELAYLGAVMLVGSLFVVWLGKDTSWDFRNYHWYIPYAFLHGRLGFDVAVAHQATYYNPLLDVPFYLLANHTPSWFALGCLGMVQAANVVPLYLIARSMLRVPRRKIAAAALALFCLTGSLTIGLAGTTYYDNVLSLFVLGALAALIVNREILRDGPPSKASKVSGFAGLAVGAAVGLKLPEAIYAFGLAGALLAMPGSLKRRTQRLLAGAAGGVLGVFIFAGFWFLKMYRDTGNPLFPYFNQIFHSPLALQASYRDARFIPHRWPKRLLYPILFSFHWKVANDLPFQDIRVGLAYVLAIVSAPLALFRSRRAESIAHAAVVGTLFAFAAVSYVVWVFLFGIYRYILTLEMLAPILIVGAIGVWPVRRSVQMALAAVLGVCICAGLGYHLLGRAPLGDPYIQETLPGTIDPKRSMILMTGEAPMGYLVPELPPSIPVLRIDGWMIQPEDGSKLTAETRARVAAFKGDLYVLANEYEVGRAGDALADYGLGMRWTECQLFTTNLAGPYRFCPLKRLPPKSPA